VEWKSEKRASMQSRAYDPYVIAIEMLFLLRTVNYFVSNWIIDMDRKKICMQVLFVSIVQSSK